MLVETEVTEGPFLVVTRQTDLPRSHKNVTSDGYAM